MSGVIGQKQGNLQQSEPGRVPMIRPRAFCREPTQEPTTVTSRVANMNLSRSVSVTDSQQR